MAQVPGGLFKNDFKTSLVLGDLTNLSHSPVPQPLIADIFVMETRQRAGRCKKCALLCPVHRLVDVLSSGGPAAWLPMLTMLTFLRRKQRLNEITEPGGCLDLLSLGLIMELH